MNARVVVEKQWCPVCEKHVEPEGQGVYSVCPYCGEDLLDAQKDWEIYEKQEAEAELGE